MYGCAEQIHGAGFISDKKCKKSTPSFKMHVPQNALYTQIMINNSESSVLSVRDKINV